MSKREVYYRKEGRKYVPVAESAIDLFEALPYGFYVVEVNSTGQHSRRGIDPRFADFAAAALHLKSRLVDILLDASRAKLSAKQPLTPEQLAAWQELNRVFGDSISLLHPSLQDIAAQFLEEIQRKAQELHDNPTVRAAYEQYLMAVELTRDK
ncbi:MAG: hypothetical protein N2235_02470 [Fischerella sp.]|nr:hypothetical protein [Fischerella sp.]